MKKLKPRHYAVEKVLHGTQITYTPSLVKTKGILLNKPEQIKQFIDLLEEAGYKEEKDD